MGGAQGLSGQWSVLRGTVTVGAPSKHVAQSGPDVPWALVRPVPPLASSATVELLPLSS